MGSVPAGLCAQLVRRALDLDTLSPAARALEERAIIQTVAEMEKTFQPLLPPLRASAIKKSISHRPR